MPKILPGFAFALLLGLGFCIYQPGLAGGFLFDDYANLPTLGAFGPINDTSTLARYLTSGSADPTGRPVAVASFLLDAQTWPADPQPFKRTNLLIHLLNGALLIWLLLWLGRERHIPEQHAQHAAVLGGALWLLHPLFVSTTLYIVQREAMLPATFSLLGLLGYLHGRNQLLHGQAWRGGILAAASIGTATLLATLSKANGVLLPLLALTLEFTILRAPSPSAVRGLNALRVLVLGLPTGLLLAYLLHLFPADLGVVPGARPWSYAQRLLTEPRVLLDYLRLLWLPGPYTSGLFNDQFIPSTGLLRPWTTLPALLLVIALPLAAWGLRHRFPLLAAAILFYLAGQLLESSFIALELYFEHRNYLPALLMFWPLAVWLTAPGKHRWSKMLLSLLLVLMLAGMTHLRSSLWGNQTEQALLWAELNPGSPRAIAYAAQFEMHWGQAAQAEQRLRHAIAQHPDEPQLSINLLGARCQQGSVGEDDLALAVHSLYTTRTGTGLLFHWFAEAIVQAESNSCAGLDYRGLQTLIDAAWKNPQIADIPGRRQDLLHLEGRMALAQGNATTALQKFNIALQTEPKLAIALNQAALLGSAGLPCAGIAHLDLLTTLQPQWQPAGFNMADIHARLLQAQGYWSHEISHIQTQLRHDAQQKLPQGCSPQQHIGLDTLQ